MSYNESNVIRDSLGRFDGVRHGEAEGGTDVLTSPDVEARLGGLMDIGMDSDTAKDFGTGTFTDVGGVRGYVFGSLDSDGYYHWDGDGESREVRLHQMVLSRDDRPGAGAYASNLMHVGMDFNRGRTTGRDVMEASRQFFRSIDEYSLGTYSRDAYDRLGWAVESGKAPDGETCRRVLETAGELAGAMLDEGSL